MRFLYASLLVAIAISFHFVALYTGLYTLQMREGMVWFDNLLHMLVGGAFALIWLALLARLFPKASFLLQAGSALMFVTMVAAGWEVFEYGFYLVFKSGALGLTVYEPSLREAVVDSLSTVAGAAALLAARRVYAVFSGQEHSV